MERQEAETWLTAWLSKPDSILDRGTVDKVLDAYNILRYPAPQTLCDEFAKTIQVGLPPGYTAIAEPYLGRVRVSVVKDKALRMWKNRPKEEHD